MGVYGVVFRGMPGFGDSGADGHTGSNTYSDRKNNSDPDFDIEIPVSDSDSESYKSANGRANSQADGRANQSSNGM